jgi:hypothetical protein
VPKLGGTGGSVTTRIDGVPEDEEPLVALNDAQVQTFVRDGFVRLDAAVPLEVALRCQDRLWEATGYDRTDPRTWSDTLVRLDGFGTEPFRQAATAPALHEAYDQLVGPGAWIPRTGLGTFPLRFPGPGAAQEAGWHVEASFTGPAGEWRVNLRSRGRALLMLFLFSDVGARDAPTRVAHRGGVPRFMAQPPLEPVGDLDLDGGRPSPVAQAIRTGLGRP